MKYWHYSARLEKFRTLKSYISFKRRLIIWVTHLYLAAGSSRQRTTLQSRPLPSQQTAHKWDHFCVRVMCAKDSSNIFLKLERALNDYLRKEKKLDWPVSRTENPGASKILKSKSMEPPVLALPQPHRAYIIDTDSSAYALGAFLLPQQNDSNLN